MLSSVLLLFGLASVFQYTMPSENKPWYEVHSKKEIVESNELFFHVLLQNVVSRFYFCGGSMITRLYVLTAAECVVGRKPADIMVHVGLKKINQTHKYMRLTRKIIIHEKYDPSSDPWLNDIALLRLNMYIPRVYCNGGVIRIPKQDEYEQILDQIGELLLPATVSGYGIITESQPPMSSEMLKSNTVIYDWKFCHETLKIHYNVSESHICAYDPFFPKTLSITRISDVGSPLVFDSNVVVGIALSANWGIHSKTYFPLLFTNVASHWNWTVFHLLNNICDDSTS